MPQRFIRPDQKSQIPPLNQPIEHSDRATSQQELAYTHDSLHEHAVDQFAAPLVRGVEVMEQGVLVVPVGGSTKTRSGAILPKRRR
jgi:hypothetical protein